jgi:hypothetical protein
MMRALEVPPMKALLTVVAFVAVASVACTSDRTPSEQATASATPRNEPALQVSLTATVAAPSPTPCPACPTATACPTCPACALCPEPLVCPPAPDPLSWWWSDLCTGRKVSIQIDNLLLEARDQGMSFVGESGETVRARVDETQRLYDQECLGVAAAEPSWMTQMCATAARWAAMLKRDALYAPDPLTQTYADQFSSIVYEYCLEQE